MTEDAPNVVSDAAADAALLVGQARRALTDARGVLIGTGAGPMEQCRMHLDFSRECLEKLASESRGFDPAARIAAGTRVFEGLEQLSRELRGISGLHEHAIRWYRQWARLGAELAGAAYSPEGARDWAGAPESGSRVSVEA
jgi:hypothetical protein